MDKVPCTPSFEAERVQGDCHERNEALTNYTEITAEERFTALDQMATQLFGTARWKTEFANRYDLTRQAVGEWSRKGAPVWACVALADALAAQNWQRVRDVVNAETE
ncbi:hypothetical protein VWZ88_12605 [Phaeobacter sp. JH20_36]|uniref:hypothetical protein n=1 Tax=unclassified Phaeobacter TaxID=2621772 RepID=UPI003A8AB82C